MRAFVLLWAVLQAGAAFGVTVSENAIFHSPYYAGLVSALAQGNDGSLVFTSSANDFVAEGGLFVTKADGTVLFQKDVDRQFLGGAPSGLKHPSRFATVDISGQGFVFDATGVLQTFQLPSGIAWSDPSPLPHNRFAMLLGDDLFWFDDKGTVLHQETVLPADAFTIPTWYDGRVLFSTFKDGDTTVSYYDIDGALQAKQIFSKAYCYGHPLQNPFLPFASFIFVQCSDPTGKKNTGYLYNGDLALLSTLQLETTPNWVGWVGWHSLVVTGNDNGVVYRYDEDGTKIGSLKVGDYVVGNTLRFGDGSLALEVWDNQGKETISSFAAVTPKLKLRGKTTMGPIQVDAIQARRKTTPRSVELAGQTFSETQPGSVVAWTYWSANVAQALLFDKNAKLLYRSPGHQGLFPGDVTWLSHHSFVVPETNSGYTDDKGTLYRYDLAD